MRIDVVRGRAVGRPLLLIALMVWLGARAGTAAQSSGEELAQGAGRSLIGSPAPRLVLRTIDGTSIDLGRLYGHKAVYLKFWATWCVPCRQQMPHFEHAFETAGDDLAVIAVNTGFNDSLVDVRAYRQKLGLRMPMVIDDGRLAAALHLRVTPQHIVIGRDGKIAYIGHLADEPLEAALKAARMQSPVDAVPRASSREVAYSTGYRIGDRIASQSVRTLDGRDRPLIDPAGKRSTVLLFLSPWCESYLATSRPERAQACRHAREASERLATSSAARWIGIASGLWATEPDLREYASTQHVGIGLSLDESGALFRRFGVTTVPMFVVIDSSGHLQSKTAHPPALGT